MNKKHVSAAYFLPFQHLFPHRQNTILLLSIQVFQDKEKQILKPDFQLDELVLVKQKVSS